MQESGEAHMDWLQFTAAVIGHLAWPVVFLIMIFALRRHLGSLAERILELSFGGAKITFDKYLAKGAELIAEAPVAESAKANEPQQKLESKEPPLPPPPPEPAPNLSALWKRKVRRFLRGKRGESMVGLMMMLTSLEEVDRLLYSIGDALGIDAADPSSVVYSLRASEQISKGMFELYQNLRSAKRVIETTYSLPTEDEASEFVRQAGYLSTYLRLLEAQISLNKVADDKIESSPDSPKK